MRTRRAFAAMVAAFSLAFAGTLVSATAQASGVDGGGSTPSVVIDLCTGDGKSKVTIHGNETSRTWHVNSDAKWVGMGETQTWYVHTTDPHAITVAWIHNDYPNQVHPGGSVDYVHVNDELCDNDKDNDKKEKDKKDKGKDKKDDKKGKDKGKDKDKDKDKGKDKDKDKDKKDKKRDKKDKEPVELEAPKVDITLCYPYGKSTVKIYGNDTRRTWSVNGVEKWVEAGHYQVWTVKTTELDDIKVKWYHEGSKSWKYADEDYVHVNDKKCPDEVVHEDPPKVDVKLCWPAGHSTIKIHGGDTYRTWSVNGIEKWVGADKTVYWKIPATESEDIVIKWWHENTKSWKNVHPYGDVDYVHVDDKKCPEEVIHEESPKVNVHVCWPYDKTTVKIHGGDTRRTWSVNGVEKWVEMGAWATWILDTTDVDEISIQWWHENTKSWKTVHPDGDVDYLKVKYYKCPDPKDHDDDDDDEYDDEDHKVIDETEVLAEIPVTFTG